MKGLVLASQGLIEPDHLLEQWDGLGETAGLPVGQGEIGHGTVDLGIVAIGTGLAEPEHFLKQRDGLGVPAGLPVR